MGRRKKVNAEEAAQEVVVEEVNETAIDQTQETEEIQLDGTLETEEENTIDEENVLDADDAALAAEILQEAPFYDVEYDREVFMELRKILDTSFAKKNKSKKDNKEYEDVVYRLTTNCTDDKHLQDFMGYCYKKGKYDFCLMNFDKYIKWTVLAGSSGNAFSLSKLQLSFIPQLEEIFSIEGIELVADNFGLDDYQFIMVLLKKLCDQLVIHWELTAEKLIKEPEVYTEQTEQLMRKIDRAKAIACEGVKKECEELIESINTLENEIKIKDEMLRELSLVNNQYSEMEDEEDEGPVQLTEEEIQAEALKQTVSSNRFIKKDKKNNKKKFRW